jgi:UrcA family protein
MHTHTTPRWITRTTFAGAALCGALFVSSAFAAEPGQTPEQKVSYADLDLTRAESIAPLYRRIHSAAENVCAPFESRELARRTHWRACVESAISRAIAQINVPALTAYADARNDHPASRLTASNVR